MLESIVELIGFVQFLKNLQNNYKLKKAFTDEIEVEVRLLEDAYSNLLIAFYTMVGATTFGNLIPPENSDHTIKKIKNGIEESIMMTEKAIVQLAKTLKTHEEEINIIFKNEPTTRFILRDLIASTDCANEKIDWSYLSTKKNFIHFELKDLNQNSFSTELSKEINPILNNVKVNEIVWDRKIVFNIEKMWNNKEFRDKYVDLIQEYTN